MLPDGPIFEDGFGHLPFFLIVVFSSSLTALQKQSFFSRDRMLGEVVN